MVNCPTNLNNIITSIVIMVVSSSNSNLIYICGALTKYTRIFISTNLWPMLFTISCIKKGVTFSKLILPTPLWLVYASIIYSFHIVVGFSDHISTGIFIHTLTSHDFVIRCIKFCMFKRDSNFM